MVHDDGNDGDCSKSVDIGAIAQDHDPVPGPKASAINHPENPRHMSDPKMNLRCSMA